MSCKWRKVDDAIEGSVCECFIWLQKPDLHSSTSNLPGNTCFCPVHFIIGSESQSKETHPPFVHASSYKAREQHDLVASDPWWHPEGRSKSPCPFPPSAENSCFKVKNIHLQAKHQEFYFLGNSVQGNRIWDDEKYSFWPGIYIHSPPHSWGFLCSTRQGPKLLQVEIHLMLNGNWSRPLSLALLLRSLGDYYFLLATSGPPFPIPIKWLWSFTSFEILYSKCTPCANGLHGYGANSCLN